MYYTRVASCERSKFLNFGPPVKKHSPLGTHVPKAPVLVTDL